MLAEELGVTAANADEMAKSSAVPAIQRLLGSSGELGSRLGLDNKWMVQAIKAGGNYGEIFERNVAVGRVDDDLVRADASEAVVKSHGAGFELALDAHGGVAIRHDANAPTGF